MKRVVNLVLVALAIAAPAAAQWDLSWYTIDGGGTNASIGGSFSLGGTIGQPDASSFSQPMTDAAGVFELVGGFWSAAPPSTPCVGDVNGDRQVDLSDLAILLAHFGVQSGAPLASGDLTGDHAVDLNDLALLLAHFGAIC